MFGWVIIFFTGSAVFFLKDQARSRLNRNLGFVSVFVAGYLGGIELWLSLVLNFVARVTGSA
jgi:hypothetical protein